MCRSLQLMCRCTGLCTAPSARRAGSARAAGTLPDQRARHRGWPPDGDPGRHPERPHLRRSECQHPIFMQCRALNHKPALASWLIQLSRVQRLGWKLGMQTQKLTQQALRRGNCIVGELAIILRHRTQTNISEEVLNGLDASGVMMTCYSERSSLMQVPDASRSSMMVGASQQDPSTPTSMRGGDPSASSAFASPLQLPEAGVFL